MDLNSLPSEELTNIPSQGTFEHAFPFPKVGYVIVPWRVAPHCSNQEIPSMGPGWTLINSRVSLQRFFAPPLARWEANHLVLQKGDNLALLLTANAPDLKK